jgi:citrate synthase
VLRDSSHEVLDELGIKGELLLDLAMELEKSPQRRLFHQPQAVPNVDFYSGIILKAMGFPTSMFTCCSAIARTVGWVRNGPR